MGVLITHLDNHQILHAPAGMSWFSCLKLWLQIVKTTLNSKHADSHIHSLAWNIHVCFPKVSAPQGIPQSPSGQSGAGTGQQIPQLGLLTQRDVTAKGRGVLWNGRTSPQGRLLSSLAQHPALPLPQLYQNMPFLNKTNRDRGSNFATKKNLSFHGCLITFYHNTNHEAICFKQRIFSPLQTDNNPIKEPTSRILDNVWHCVIISIPLVSWQGTAMLSWSSWQHSKAQSLLEPQQLLWAPNAMQIPPDFFILSLYQVFHIKLYPGK